MVTLTRETDHGIATMLSSVPFGKSPVVRVEGDRLLFGSKDENAIKVFGNDRTLLRIVRLAVDPVPSSDSDVARHIEAELARIEDDDGVRALRQELEAMPRMELLPPYGSIFADASGTLFVTDFALPGQETRGVNVFDPAGKLTGRFEIPAALEILEVGPDYLLTLFEDELGVESVRLYELTRSG
jgi:hypothetical protein